MIKLGCDEWREIFVFRILAISKLARQHMVPFSGAVITMSHTLSSKLKHELNLNNSMAPQLCWFDNIVFGLLETKVTNLHKPSKSELNLISQTPRDLDYASRVTLACEWIVDTITSNFDRNFDKGSNIFYSDDNVLTLIDAARWRFGSVRGKLAKTIEKYHGKGKVCDGVVYPILIIAKSIIDEICGPSNGCLQKDRHLLEVLSSEPFFFSLKTLVKHDLQTIYKSSEQGKKGQNAILNSCLNSEQCDSWSFLARDASEKLNDIFLDAHNLFWMCKAKDGGDLVKGSFKIVLQGDAGHL